MKKNMEDKAENLYFFSLLTLLALIILLFSYILVWNTYKTDIINEQKEQMQMVSTLVSKSLEESLKNHVDEILLIASQQEEDNFHRMLEIYVDEYSAYVENTSIYSDTGELLWSLYEARDTVSYGRYGLQEEVFLTEYVNDKQEMLFVFSKFLEDGRIFRVELNMKEYYETMISDIKIGDSGYVVVKNHQGIILMHPLDIQIGKHILDGRAELYPDVDLISLEDLVEFQISNETGVLEYDSYWWLQENVPSARKISAHQQLNLGHDFLIISAVVDYDEIYSPIQDGFRNTAFIFLMILLLLLTFFAYIAQLLLTNQKNLEEIDYLRDLNMLLENNKKIEERIAHQQRLQLVGTMTSGITHEFNNMLTPIMGYSELLLLTLEEESDEQDFALEILNASLRAKEIIQQISALGRKKNDTHFQFLRAGTVISARMIQSMCQPHIQLSFQNHIKEDCGFLGNETQINQVLLNLVVNGSQAIPTEQNDGQVEVTVSLATSEEIHQSHETNILPIWEQYICISVKDNGSGMNSNTLSQIFNAFFTTKKKEQGLGLGLGLALVAQIVETHKGYIFVKSKEGEGSEFFLYFPMVEEGMEETISQGSQDKFQILFIANQSRTMKEVGKSLEKLDVESLFTQGTNEARVLLNTNVPVIVIEKDLNTAKGNHRGLHFAMAVHKQYPNVVKILLVDHVDKEIIEAKERGLIQDFVKKPLTTEKLLNKLRQCNH